MDSVEICYMLSAMVGKMEETMKEEKMVPFQENLPCNWGDHRCWLN